MNSNRCSFGVLVSSFIGGFLIGVSPALAGHSTETCSDAGFKEEMAVSESAWMNVFGKAGDMADIRVIDPSPPVADEIIRSIYLWKTEDDLVEFGYQHGAGAFPLVFSVKVYNTNYSESFDGWPSNPNPGAGPLTEGSNHTFRIWRNPNGDDANRIEMHRDGQYFGYYNHDRVVNAAVLAGAEGFSRCDDMQTHVWTMKAKDCPSCSWVNWSAVRIARDIGPTKWWYNSKTQNPLEWWVHHCSVANCPDT
jgi:hypothetical protein